MSHLPLINGFLPSSLISPGDANGLGPVMAIRKAFTAGGGGAADDVTVYNANAPFGFRILEVQVFVSTAAIASTAQLRNTTGGGGAAILAAFSTTATGRVAFPLTDTATATVAANGTLVLRRSDNGVAGEVVIYLIKT